MPGRAPDRPVRAQHGRELPAPRHDTVRRPSASTCATSRRTAGSWSRPGSRRASSSSSRSRSTRTSSRTSRDDRVRRAATSRRSASVRFDGEVWAVPEGRIVHAGEPILEVTAPLAEAQLVETLLLNQVTLHTTLASKAARYRLAARRTRTWWTSRSGARTGSRRRWRSRAPARSWASRRRRTSRPRAGTASRSPARWRTRSSRRSRRRSRRSARSRRIIPSARRSSSTRTTR